MSDSVIEYRWKSVMEGRATPPAQGKNRDAPMPMQVRRSRKVCLSVCGMETLIDQAHEARQERGRKSGRGFPRRHPAVPPLNAHENCILAAMRTYRTGSGLSFCSHGQVLKR